MLEKVYTFRDPSESDLLNITGCKIDWQPGQDTTLKIVEKKLKSKKSKGKPKEVQKIIEEVPCDSFFSFFKPPLVSSCVAI